MAYGLEGGSMDTAHALLDLQEADLEITRAERRLDELPEKGTILHLRHKMVDVGKLREKTAEFASRLSREIAKLEDAVAQTAEKMDEEQAKLLSGQITNLKELTSISTEIEMLRRKKERFEEDMMALMEKREMAQLQVSKIDEALSRAGDDEAKLVDKFQKAGGDILADIEKLKRKRNRLAKALDPAILERYEKIRATRNGIAAGKLEGDMCGCCRTTLPAVSIQQLRKPDGDAVSECPNCRRLIVVVD
jgi:predicted  nucleic acid-binding Zn-ribbon protein